MVCGYLFGYFGLHCLKTDASIRGIQLLETHTSGTRPVMNLFISWNLLIYLKAGLNSGIVCTKYTNLYIEDLFY